MDLEQARVAVADPATSGADLQMMAVSHHELWAQIAAHPKAYPGLLAWLDDHGDDEVKAAVAFRRASDAEPAVEPPASAPALPAPRPSLPRKFVVGIVIGVVAVALVVAGVIIIPRMVSGGGITGGGITGGLKVTGDAPASATRQPTFLDGYRTLTKVDTETDSMIGATDDIVLLSEYTDREHTVAIDKMTGQTLWTIPGRCDLIAAASALVCYDYEDNGSQILDWVDLATGQSQGQLDFSSMGADVYANQPTARGELIIVGAEAANFSGDDAPATAGYFTGPGQPVWTSSVQYAEGGADRNPTFDEGDGLLAWYASGMTYVFDEQTGYVVYQKYDFASAQIFPGRMVCMSYDEYGDEPISQHQVDVPGGSPVTIMPCDDSRNPMVMFNSTGHPDIVLTGGDRGVQAYDPSSVASGQTKWASPDWPAIADITWDGDTTAYAIGWNGRLWAFDVQTGQALWWSSLGLPSGATEDDVWYMRISVSDSLIVTYAGLYEGSGQSFGAFRVDNGQPINAFDSLKVNYLSLANGVLLQQYSSNANLIVPSFSDNVTQLMAAPSDMPSCPAGMTAVSWTKYDTGSVLVCSGAGSYQVVLLDTNYPKWRAAELLFDPAGMLITCSDGTTIRLGAGGSVMIVDAGGTLTTYAASEAWTPGLGQVNYQGAPSGIQSCPAGAWPISLSTWNGGWLLVCGTDLATPTWLGFSDGRASGSSTNVTATGVSYCASLDAGLVCSYAAPAMVTLTPTSGDALQYPVDSNYFPGTGAGGTGLGTGAYGVNVPTSDSPAEQARYLEQVLQASAKARSDLKSVMNHLNNKIATPQDIAILQSVVDARNQQIAAIDGAPVTALPDGANLASKLRQALVVSEQTDELYVQWAQDIQAGDWTSADATIAQWRGPAHQSDVLKQAFCDQWNADIAPTYGVSKFKASQI